MNIQFNNIIIDNFMSIEHIELNLKDLGIILVKGQNYSEPKSKSNGSGKSALTSESILWCLTGETNKEARTINNIYIKDSIAKVKLDLTIDNNSYIIERINSTNKELHIIKNGQDISGNTYTKSKEILDNEFGFINKEILTSIIILGQGLKGKFSELKASERKTRLEYLVGIDSLLELINNSLSNADNVITKLTNDNNLKIAEQNTIINSSQELIKKYDVQAPISEEEYQQKCKEYNEIAQQYNDIKEEIIKLKEEVQTHLVSKDNLNNQLIQITNQLSTINNEVLQIKHKQETIQTNIKNLNSQKELAEKAECPTCHQHLQNKEVEQHIKQEIENLTNQLNTLESIENKQQNINQLTLNKNEIMSKINDIQAEINQINQKVNEKTSQVNNLYTHIQEYDNFLKQYEKYKQEVNQLKQIIADSNKKIKQAETELIDLNNKNNKLTNDKNINKYFKNAVSRKFRNFLLEGVFNYLNNKLSLYSSQLFTNQIIKLESNGNNIDIRLNEKYIEDCSGGECRKIDLAIQFALRDLAKNQRGINISLICLDEVLDYLDSTALEEVLKFIENQTSDVNTMFITSHKEDINIQYDNILEVYKDEKELTHVKG